MRLHVPIALDMLARLYLGVVTLTKPGSHRVAGCWSQISAGVAPSLVAGCKSATQCNPAKPDDIASGPDLETQLS